MVVPGDADGWNRDKIRKSLEGDVNTVIGVFPDVESAERGLSNLRKAGFDEDVLSLVARGSDAADEVPSQAASEKAGKSALAGAAIGGVGGGVLAGLIGAGLLAIPGAGPLLAAGWLASALGGAAVGAGAGGWIGAIAQLGVPEDVARRYIEQVSQGQYLVMVLAKRGQEEQAARQALQDGGAESVESYEYQVRPEAFPGSESPAERPPGDEPSPGL